MLTRIQQSWKNTLSRNSTNGDAEESIQTQHAERAEKLDLVIAQDDPIISYFTNSPDAVEIDKISIQSDALNALKKANVKMVVPLVSQGELIGLLNLGPRLSEQEYSADDRRLLNTLATQAAPALRVAQLARQQQAEAREKERRDHELRVARVIQQTLLPKELPKIENYQLAAHWQPAREVSGDFYDFIQFPDGRLGIVIGDVTDKGVPAAMVMATTRSVFRATAERYISPGQVLKRTNELLVPDIPHNMFVTCLYIVLNPVSGEMVYANAGHNLPYLYAGNEIIELRATGMPLGLMPGMEYEEKEAVICSGDSVILYSDGLVEAHNPEGEMFSNQRLERTLSANMGGENIIPYLIYDLAQFTGENWEQEDDVTFVTISRADQGSFVENGTAGQEVLGEFRLTSEPGNERRAMEKTAEIIRENGLLIDRLDQIKTAVAEATMNAMEHGNKYDPGKWVNIKVVRLPDTLSIYIVDQSGEHVIPAKTKPDLEAKLAGEQSPRGWGLFLIENMVDKMEVIKDENHHTLHLLFNIKEKADDIQTV